MLGGSEARAGDAAAPRVPPSFLDATCLQVVDQKGDPTLHIPIGIPFEDTARTADELPDSRTLQFFALCRGPDAMQTMPPWVDPSDIARAAALDPSVGSPGPTEVLGTAPPFAGPGHDGADGTCVVPIVASEARIPITCEATQEGVVWDTTLVPAGAYEVWGYTFAPVASLWTPRPGVVRIVDGDDPTSAGPAVAWSWPLSEVTAGLDGGVTLVGCAAGGPGTTVAIEWATAADLDRDPASAWVALAEIEIDGAADLSIPFVPPAELLYQAVFVRAVARDPEGRTFTATTRAPIVWRPGCDAPAGGRIALVDACGPGDPLPTGAAADGAGGCEAPEGPPATEDPEPSGAPDLDDDRDDDAAAGCRLAGSPDPVAAIFALAILVPCQSPTRRTRVRSCASSPRT